MYKLSSEAKAQLVAILRSKSAADEVQLRFEAETRLAYHYAKLYIESNYDVNVTLEALQVLLLEVERNNG
jgi:hypothetical protein